MVVVEHLRHLLFHEQGLGRFAPGAMPFSPLGCPPPGLWKHGQLAALSFEATPAADEVLAEWDSAHLAIRDSLQRDDAEVRQDFGKVVRHLQDHVKQIESAIRARTLRAGLRSRGGARGSNATPSAPAQARSGRG